jgi:putative ABC transport system permease protein
MKFGKLILRNILRNKRRSALTISSLAVSLFLIVTLGTVLTELARGSAEANPLRLVSRHAVSLMFDLPLAYQSKIAAVPGVKLVTPYSWYGGIYIEPKNFFANFAVDAAQLRAYQSEIRMSDTEWEAFIGDRQGAIVGKKLTELHRFTIGQRVTLKSDIYDNELEFIIRGVYTGGDEKTLFFHYAYLNESSPAWAKDSVGTYGIVAASRDDVPRIAQAIDAMFVNTDAPTKTETEREFAISFETMMGGVKQFMYGIMAAIAFSLLLVTANSMAMSVRERTREVGTLKALGFQRSTIAGLFVAEALLLAVAGAVVGVGGAMALFNSFDFSLYLPTFIHFKPTMATLGGAFGAALLIGCLSVAYSAYRITSLATVEALRRVE